MKGSSSDVLPILWRTQPPSNDYETARRRVFNGRQPEHFSLAIVKAVTVDHIIASVRLAAELDVPIAIRSGGHSLSCWTMRHGAILIDLENFKHLSYNEETCEVQASPSTLGADLLTFLAKRKRFFPVGHTGDIGLGGYLLQGGIGLNSRGYGYACEYITGLDVVTFDGEIKHCDATENSDLYWAARGAGPEFPAIVTRFYLKTCPLLPVCKRSRYVWPAIMYEKVFAWLDKLLTSLSEDVEVAVFGFILPQLNQPGLVLHATAFGDSDEDSREKLNPIIENHPPGTFLAEDCVSTNFPADYDLGKDTMPRGARYFTDSVFLKPGTDIVTTCKGMFTGLKHPRALAYWQPMKSSVDRTLPDMAMSIHSDHYVSLLAIYEDPKEDQQQASWIIDHMRSLEPSILGTFVGDAHPLERPSNYWSEEAKELVLAIGRKWDPSGRIRGTILGHV
ncbi:FAD binding domain protein [Hypoxylon sp. FL0890]|nr:FAD binding domain protein [Hypoxylon sp. FL0890]